MSHLARDPKRQHGCLLRLLRCRCASWGTLRRGLPLALAAGPCLSRCWGCHPQGTSHGLHLQPCCRLGWPVSSTTLLACSCYNIALRLRGLGSITRRHNSSPLLGGRLLPLLLVECLLALLLRHGLLHRLLTTWLHLHGSTDRQQISSLD